MSIHVYRPQAITTILYYRIGKSDIAPGRNQGNIYKCTIVLRRGESALVYNLIKVAIVLTTNSTIIVI